MFSELDKHRSWARTVSALLFQTWCFCEQVMKDMEKNIRANDYRSILNFFKVISEVRLVEEELRNYVIKVFWRVCLEL